MAKRKTTGTLTAATLEKPPIDQIKTTIVERLKPRRIIVFGSYARGEAGLDSDIDLLVEMNTDLPRPQREMMVHSLFRNRRWAMDVFVYTPEEVAARRHAVGSIVHTAEQEGTIVYERP